MIEEEWRDIPGWEGYYRVSNLGRIKSLERRVAGRWGLHLVRGKVLLSNRLENDQYPVVGLHRQGVQSNRCVHLLVLEAFVGPRPQGLEGCHNDGNAHNNVLHNLRWDTPAGNQYDRIVHGTDIRGEKSASAKLTEREVLEIRKRYATGDFTQKALALEYGVSKGHLGQIVNRNKWTYV